MKVKEKKLYKKSLELRQGDVILVNYGKFNAGCRTSGIRPSVVVSNDAALKEENLVNVIPLYRKPSKAFQAEDILIRPVDCRGLRYEEYAQPMQMQILQRFRIIKRIGHIMNDSILCEIANAIWNSINKEI